MVPRLGRPDYLLIGAFTVGRQRGINLTFSFFQWKYQSGMDIVVRVG